MCTVSYTHLDVYKRQYVDIWLASDIYLEKFTIWLRFRFDWFDLIRMNLIRLAIYRENSSSKVIGNWQIQIFWILLSMTCPVLLRTYISILMWNTNILNTNFLKFYLYYLNQFLLIASLIRETDSGTKGKNLKFPSELLLSRVSEL